MIASPPALPANVRVFLAFIWPPLVGAGLAALGGNLGEAGGGAPALLFAGIGVMSWLFGARWYGLVGLGLRGGRPLFASIGFAVLGWVILLLARFVSVVIVLNNQGGLGATFVYLLVFEAFCLQVWALGVFFHSAADWRNPLVGALLAGGLLGAAGYFLSAEVFRQSAPAVLYFLVWGLLYGLIRLRTGSLLGTVLVQAVQSFTVWYLMVTPNEVPVADLNRFYLISALFFAILAWRLWPRRVSDYRV